MSWNGVKQQSYKQEIKSWCEEMKIENYAINPKGEIDVDDSVRLRKKDFKEIPYKFGKVTGSFDIGNNKKLTSLKNCPNNVLGYFACDFCSQLDSLEGRPEEVWGDFWCNRCKREFTEEEVMSLCKVKGDIFVC